MTLVFNPLTPPFDYTLATGVTAPITLSSNLIGFDQSFDFDWTGDHEFGVSGTGVDVTFHSATAGKALRWTPNAASSSPVLQFDILSGRGAQIDISGTDTSFNSFPIYLNVDVTQQYTGAVSVAYLFDFSFTDKRTLNSGTTDYRRILNFTLNRTSSFSSAQQASQIAAGQFTIQDGGTYSRSAGVQNIASGLTIDFSGFSPIMSASSGSGYYNTNGFVLSGTIGGNGNGFTSNTHISFDSAPAYVQISGSFGYASHTHYGARVRPSFTVVSGTSPTVYGYTYEPTWSFGSPAIEWAFYATRSGIGLVSDATVGSMATGRLVMGASSDWERGYESDNEAFENIPTGAVYDWRINAVDQMSLGLRSLTLGDNTSNDFTITFNQTNDATLKWDSADQTFYWRTNGAPEYNYPSYAAGVSVTTGGVSSPNARYALQSWGIPAASFGSLGGYWGGFSENDSSTGYGGNEAYGGTFYNYFTGTNARTIGSIFGNYVGNEFSVTTALTATTIRGVYIGVAEGGGSITTAINFIALDIVPINITATGTTPTNSYMIKLGNTNTIATNNYGVFLGTSNNICWRAGTQAIWSPSASVLRRSANTTHEWYLGANPANGTAGTLYLSLTSSALTLTDAVNLAFGTTTGTKIGTATTQKIGLWNATPIVQPTTAVAAATRVGGGGTTVTDTDTFDGYTIAQVVKALRNMGALA